MAGRSETAAGQIRSSLIESSLKVDDALIRRYAAMTRDGNPLHLDPAFAAATPMGGIIAHGTLLLAPLWQALEQTLGRERLAGIVLDIRFKRPVRPGDVITAGGTRRRDGRSYDVWVEAADGTRVIEGTALSTATPARGTVRTLVQPRKKPKPGSRRPPV